MKCLKCTQCNYLAVAKNFVTTYDLVSKSPIYICPRCFNVASDEIVEEKSCKE